MPSNIPDISGVKKFKNYRDKGLSYREISKLTGKPLVTLFRWNRYILNGILSTKGNKKVIHS